MLVNKEYQKEERGEDSREPIDAYSIRGRVFNPNYFNVFAAEARAFNKEHVVLQFAKERWPLVALTVLGGSILIPSAMDGGSSAYAEAECSADRGLAWSTNGATLSVYSECEGPIFQVYPLTEKQEEARVRANVLTTNLGESIDRTRYEWLNVPYQELPLDRVGGGRLMADAELLDIMKGNTKTPEGSEKVEALQIALNNYASEINGYSTTLDFSNLTNLYLNDSSQPNNISQLTVETLKYFGVKDADLFRANARIHFSNGSPVEVKEWQTGLRGAGDRPNHVIAEIPSRLGNYSVVIEESGLEGWIQLLDSDTRRGIRSIEVPISIMLAPINEDPNYVMLIIMDRSCGNIIEMLPVPITSIEKVEELIEEMAAPTPISTTVVSPPGGGGSGPGPENTPVPPQPTVIRPPSTPQPTPEQPTVVPSTPIRPPSTPQPTSAIPAPTSVPPAPTSVPPRPVSPPGA